MKPYSALLYILKNWKKLALISLIVSVFTFFIVDLFPKIYNTEAKLIVTDNSGRSTPSISMGGLDNFIGSSSLLGSSNKSSLVFLELVKDRSTLVDVIHKFKLDTIYKAEYDNSNVKKFRKDLLVEQDEKSGVILIGYESHDRTLAIKVINEIVNLATQKYRSLQINRIHANTEYLRTRQKNELDTIFTLQRQIINLHKKNNVYDFDKQLEISVEIFGRLEESLNLAKMKRDLIKKASPSTSLDLQNSEKEVEVIEQALRKQKQENNVHSSLTLTPSRGVEGKLHSEELALLLKSHFEILKLITIELSQNESELSKNAPIVQIISNAYYPDWKTKPKRLYWLVLSFLMTLIFGCFYYSYKGIKNGSIPLDKETADRLKKIQDAIS